MRCLRRTVLLRLWAVLLLGSLGLGVGAPAAAAVQPGGPAAWLTLDAVPQAALDAALAKAAGADTPEAYAEALAASLRALLGAAAPPADALLAALYGQLFRVLQEHVGARAVVAASGGGAVKRPLVSGAPRPPLLLPAPRTGDGKAPEAAAPGRPAPRLLRPALQPLGP